MITRVVCFLNSNGTIHPKIARGIKRTQRAWRLYGRYALARKNKLLGTLSVQEWKSQELSTFHVAHTLPYSLPYLQGVIELCSSWKQVQDILGFIFRRPFPLQENDETCPDIPDQS